MGNILDRRHGLHFLAPSSKRGPETTKAETEGRPVRRMELSGSRDGATVESASRTVGAQEDAEEPPVAKRFGAASVEDTEFDGPEVDFPAAIADGFEPNVLFVDSVAEVKLDSVDADDAVMLDVVDSHVCGILELGQLARKRPRRTAVERGRRGVAEGFMWAYVVVFPTK